MTRKKRKLVLEASHSENIRLEVSPPKFSTPSHENVDKGVERNADATRGVDRQGESHFRQVDAELCNDEWPRFHSFAEVQHYCDKILGDTAPPEQHLMAKLSWLLDDHKRRFSESSHA